MIDETGKEVHSSVDELKLLKTIFEKEGLVPSPPGIWLNKKKYHLITFRDDINAAYLKNLEGGATIIKTNKLILVGIWSKKDEQNAGDCNKEMEEFANNFIKIKY